MKKHNKVNSLRFNESGDFFSQACVKKMDYIAKGLKKHGIITYGYSARSDLNFTGVSFIIRGSGYKSKNGKTVVLEYHNLKDNQFYYNDKPVKLQKKDDWYQVKIDNVNYFLCKGDCRQCDKCLKSKGNIAFINHKSSHRHEILPEKIKGKKRYIELNQKFNVLLSQGNAKLPKNTVILNMGPAKTCPSKALGLCKVEGSCYAEKPERFYPACLPSRIRSKVYWLNNSKETILADIKAALKLV